MHIADGVLSKTVVIGADIIIAAPIIFSLIKISHKEIPKTALLSTLFFIASFIHIPLGPTSVHLIMNGLIGTLLGIHSAIAILVALFLQFLLFGYGGLTTLGVNTLNMFSGALIAYYIYRRNNLTGFLAGSLSVLVSSIMLALSLALSGKNFLEIAYLSFLAHLPIMIIEGLITMFALNYLKNQGII
ncbi:cobalt ABC transporter, permease [Deferribacter desulfuricans SSM1]|uniref:Cobalt ABC transporter, permease n=1 Tax=Deferribacter desulfuricans (strain DSM 14783 / JCM 11476 / NBRC 101012 / SSM1) TaxID=639282 RepID=D3PAC0_DEFDS|nr:cobalt transporter CbiM [Deferribacter desulfuricans]BAI79543.1 cobalt ABC transporter, permease [Deferribacter desulfuricans SSM1]